jgi:integrase
VSQSVRIPSYRLHKPSGQAIVTIGGRMFYLGRYGSVESRSEYGRVVAEWQSGPPEIPPASPTMPSAPADLTVAELFRSYFRRCRDYYVKNGRVTSQVTTIHLALDVANRLYGHTPCRDFGPLALKACRAEFVGQGLSRNECNRRTNLIKQAFRWGTENELIPAGIFHALQSVAGLRKGRCGARETTPIGPVSDAIVDRTLEHLSPIVASMARLQLLAGMRPGELVIMRARDLNMTGPVWEYRPDSYKGEHHEALPPKVIMLGPQAQEIIRPYLSLDISGYLFSPQRALDEHVAERRAGRKTKLWPSHVARQAKERAGRGRRTYGDRYSVASYRQAIARACDRAFPHPELSAIPRKRLTAEQRAELKAWRKSHRWHPNRLRHAAGTAIRRRFGLEGSQAILGHSELTSTQVYAAKSLDLAREIMRQIG